MPDTASQPKGSDGPNKPTRKAHVEPVCENCKWADAINLSQFVHCTVDLPPFIQRSNDPKRQMAHKTYRCGLWRSRNG